MQNRGIPEITVFKSMNFIRFARNKLIRNHGREDREEQDRRSVPGRSLMVPSGGVERLQVSRQLWASFSSPHLA
jgi:hypothetical protein